MQEIIIKAFYSEFNEGYMYDIYASEADMENGNSIDGGLCTSNLQNALKMAFKQAQPFIKE